MHFFKRKTSSASLDEAKKTAYSINRRMKELGYQSPLAHAYELVATTFGYKNWATMKGSSEAQDCSITIGNQTRLVNLHGEAKREILPSNFGITGPSLFNHFEVVGDKEATSHVLKKICEANAGTAGQSVYICSHLEFNEAGRPDGFGTQFATQPVGNSNHHDLFSKLTADDLSNAFKRAVIDLEPEDAPGFIWRQRIANAINAVSYLLTWLRDDGHIKLDAKNIMTSIQLKSVIDAVSNPRQMPDATRQKLLCYLQSLPRFDPTKGNRQTQTTMDHHGYVEMLIARVVERFQSIRIIPVSNAQSLVLLLPYHSPDLLRFVAELAASGAFRRNGSAGENGKPTLVFIDGADDAFDTGLEDTMAKASKNNTVMFLGWKNQPRSHALKNATTIVANTPKDRFLTVMTPMQQSVVAI